MTNRIHSLARVLLAVLAAGSLLTGCRSVTTLQLYNGPEVSADQLATLVVPWCISLRTIDGSPAPSTLANEMRLVLGPGSHTMEARYVVIFPTSGNDSEKIVSDYVRLRFKAEPGKTYTICSKDPKTLEATRRYAAHVSLWIAETGGGAKGAAMTTPAPAAQTPITTSAKPETATTTPKADVRDTRSELQKLWDNASEQDRKAFRDKVLQPHP